MPPLLEVQDLRIEFPAANGWVPVVRGLSFTVERGEFVGLAGESGSGKSATALALLRLLPPPGRIAGGRVLLHGENLLDLPERAMRAVRGARIGMVFQEPSSALDPVMSIGDQVVEALRAHRSLTRRAARVEARALLDRVALSATRRRLDDYPHQLSGGQRQRVVIAMALAGGPDLLLADEPTTALDVTVQAQILDLLAQLRSELGLAVLLITHDLAVVAETCDRLLVLYAGRAVEEGPVPEVFRAPAHPYTRGLLAAVPRLGARSADGRLAAIPGQVPDPADLPPGCAFHPRCPDRFAPCAEREPAVYAAGGGRSAACFLLESGGPAA